MAHLIAPAPAPALQAAHQPAVDRAHNHRRTRLSVYLELGKARLVSLVVLTTAVGYLIALQPVDGALTVQWSLLFFCLIGTALSACGANALNQIIERSRDARMQRTALRPLPANLLTLHEAWTAALAMAILGPILLLLTVPWPAAALAAATTLLYVLVYTPMKTRTSLNTLVGAVCGAIPPLIGYVAANDGQIGFPGLLLAAILFIWQIPHFLALAWMYRDDYARGGYVMLPAVDPDGRLTGRMAAVSAAFLIPLSLLYALPGKGGHVLLIVPAIAIGTAFTLAAIRFARSPDLLSARRLFFASLVHLPLLLGLMVLCSPAILGQSYLP